MNCEVLLRRDNSYLKLFSIFVFRDQSLGSICPFLDDKALICSFIISHPDFWKNLLTSLTVLLHPSFLLRNKPDWVTAMLKNILIPCRWSPAASHILGGLSQSGPSFSLLSMFFHSAFPSCLVYLTVSQAVGLQVLLSTWASALSSFRVRVLLSFQCYYSILFMSLYLRK